MDYQRKLATRRCLFLRPSRFAFACLRMVAAHLNSLNGPRMKPFSTDTRGNRSRYIRLHRGPTYTLGHRRFTGQCELITGRAEVKKCRQATTGIRLWHPPRPRLDNSQGTKVCWPLLVPTLSYHPLTALYPCYVHASYPFYDYSRELWSLRSIVYRDGGSLSNWLATSNDFSRWRMEIFFFSLMKFLKAFEEFERKKLKNYELIYLFVSFAFNWS